jgi:hypothetical protein
MIFSVCSIDANIGEYFKPLFELKADIMEQRPPEYTTENHKFHKND